MLIGHVARNNPLWRGPAGGEHLLVFQGPSAYISANWYATKRETGAAMAGLVRQFGAKQQA